MWSVVVTEDHLSVRAHILKPVFINVDPASRVVPEECDQTGQRIFASADSIPDGRLSLLPLGQEHRKSVPVEVIRVISEPAGLKPLQEHARAEMVLALKLAEGFLVKGNGVRVERIFPFQRGFRFLRDSHMFIFNARTMTSQGEIRAVHDHPVLLLLELYAALPARGMGGGVTSERGTRGKSPIVSFEGRLR